MVQLIFFLQAAQDRNGVLNGRLAHHHWLKTPFQRRILLHMLAILIQRGCTDAVQLAARQRRLQQVGGVHRAFGFAGTHQRVHFIDEQQDLPLGGGHFVEHGLQPLLEFAAIFGAGDQRAHIEREQSLVFQSIGDIAVGNAQRKAFHDGRLADSGLTDQYRVVLGAPREHLDGPADFLVAPDHRIKLAGTRHLGEVAAIFLQRVIAFLGAG